MTDCETLAGALAAYASGEPADSALEQHLRVCSACQGELASTRALLQDAALPAPSELQQRALAARRGATLLAWQRQERRRLWVTRAALGLTAAAAALLLALGVGHRSTAVPTTGAAADLALDALPEGPIELAGEETDPAAFDPELVPTVYSEEGDE